MLRFGRKKARKCIATFAGFAMHLWAYYLILMAHKTEILRCANINLCREKRTGFTLVSILNTLDTAKIRQVLIGR